MLKRSRIAVAFAGSLVVALAASPAAQARTFAEIYAECGIGAMLFNSGEDAAENGRTFAVISNIIWDLGTTAVSSDASSEGNCAGSSATTAALMMQAYPAIERDLARGEGEYLNALLAASGCEASVHAALGAGLRADLAASPLDADASRVDRAGYLHGSLMQRIESEHGGACTV